MISLFKSKPKTLLGVDIGSSFVKVLGLSQDGQGYKVESFSVVHLPEGAVIDNSVQDVPAVAESVEKAVRLSGSKLKAAVASVPASQVISKRLDFSKSFTEDELEDQIRVEADQYIPYPIEEVSLDFQVLGESLDSPELNDVLLVACRQDSVQLREESVNGAGLQCLVVDVDSYALERVYPLLVGELALDDANVGLVDLGASSMTLYVVEGGQVVYSREQAFGGNDLTHSISQASDLSASDVEKLKKQGELTDDLLRDYVEPFKQTAAQQISRSLQFYYSSGTHPEIEALVLMGGVGALPGFAETVQQELGVQVQVANPFQAMNVNPKINRNNLEREASSLVLATGLALRSFVE